MFLRKAIIIINSNLVNVKKKATIKIFYPPFYLTGHFFKKLLNLFIPKYPTWQANHENDINTRILIPKTLVN